MWDYLDNVVFSTGEGSWWDSVGGWFGDDTSSSGLIASSMTNDGQGLRPGGGLGLRTTAPGTGLGSDALTSGDGPQFGLTTSDAPDLWGTFEAEGDLLATARPPSNNTTGGGASDKTYSAIATALATLGAAGISAYGQGKMKEAEMENAREMRREQRANDLEDYERVRQDGLIDWNRQRAAQQADFEAQKEWWKQQQAIVGAKDSRRPTRIGGGGGGRSQNRVSYSGAPKLKATARG